MKATITDNRYNEEGLNPLQENYIKIPYLIVEICILFICGIEIKNQDLVVMC